MVMIGRPWLWGASITSITFDYAVVLLEKDTVIYFSCSTCCRMDVLRSLAMMGRQVCEASTRHKVMHLLGVATFLVHILTQALLSQAIATFRRNGGEFAPQLEIARQDALRRHARPGAGQACGTLPDVADSRTASRG